MASIKKYQAREKARAMEKKAAKLQVTGFATAFGVGVVEGMAKSSGITFFEEGIGPIRASWLQAGVGYMLTRSRKQGTQEAGDKLATIGLYKIGKEVSSGFDLGNLFG